MNPMRLLVMAVLGLTATPGYAVPLLFTLEAEPFTNWDITLRDPGGMITSINVADTDGDGLSSFTARDDSDVTMHQIRTMPLWGVRYGRPLAHSTIPFIPFLASDTGAPLIVDWSDSAVSTIALGQHVSVTGGVMVGLADGSVRLDPGIPTALDLLSIDLSALPAFTGVAEVAGLVTVQLIPEPSTGVLIVFATSSLGVIACRQRFLSRRTAKETRCRFCGSIDCRVNNWISAR